MDNINASNNRESVCQSRLRIHPLISQALKHRRPLWIFFPVGLLLACKVLTPVPTPQILHTPTLVEATIPSTSTQTQSPPTPTLAEATASPALTAVPLSTLFPKLEVMEPANVMKLQAIAELPVSGAWQVAFSPDGKKLAVGRSDGVVEIWDLTSGQLSMHLGGHESGYSVVYLSFSPDGKFLLSRAGYAPAFGDAVIVWDLSSGQKIRVLDEITAAISPDWRVLATLPVMSVEALSSGSYEEFIRLTDFKRDIELGTLKDPSNSIMDVAFSPNGRMLAMMLVGVDDSEITVWDVRSMQRIASLDELLRLNFSPDGEFAVGASWRPAMKIFETRTWTEIASLSGDKDVNFNSPIFTPDGSMVAASFGGQIMLFETGTWKEAVTLSAPDIPNSLAFSPDGRLMASYGGSENKVLLWGVIP